MSHISPPPPPPRLIFPKASTKVGRPYSIAEHCVVDPDTACRELIQNSLDAHAALQDKGPCRVSFKVSTIKTRDIPGYNDYCKAMSEARASWEANKEVANYLGAINTYLRKKEISVLFVIDNGKGFNEKGLEAVMGEGTPEKQEGSAGSFGIGHLTTYGISGLQYILYASKQQDGTELFAGHAILASHSSDGNLRSNNGYLVEEYQSKFDNPFTFSDAQNMPEFLREELEHVEHSGSIIAVLGFNGFRQDRSTKKKKLTEQICEATAENFAMAIWAGDLEIEVGGEHNPDELVPERQEIDKSQIKEFLEYMEHPETGTREQTLKARQTLDAIETFSQGDSARGHLPHPFEDCQIYLRNKTRAHMISIWRNGMLITRRHRGLAKDQFDDKKKLDAVVLLSGRRKLRRAHDIVKKAETPLHDQIQEKRLSENAEVQKLRDFFTAVRKWVSEHAEDSGGESADLENEVMLDSGNAFDVTSVGLSRLFQSQQPGDMVEGEGTHETNGESIAKTRKKSIKALAQTKIQGRVLDGCDYRVRIKPAKEITSGLLKVVMASGQDASCSGHIPDTMLIVKSATQIEATNGKNGKKRARKKYKIEDGMVRLPKLSAEEFVEMDITFSNPPKNLNQVSLSCLLGMTGESL